MNHNENPLLGCWLIDQVEEGAPEFHTPVYLRFTKDNILQWGWETEETHSTFQIVIETFHYWLAGETIGTIVPPNPRQEFTPYSFTPEGKLRLKYSYYESLWAKAKEPEFFTHSGKKKRCDVTPESVRPDYWRHRRPPSDLASEMAYERNLKAAQMSGIAVETILNTRTLMSMWAYSYRPFTSFPLEDFHYILAQGAEINAAWNCDETMLHHVAGDGNLEAVKLLLEYQAEINAKEMNGLTPLDYARNCKRYEVVQFLTQQGGVSGRALS